MRRVLLFVIASVVSATSLLEAQVRLSERAVITQTVDGTVISVDYARPRVRGRSPIFGRRVHWGEVWTPGANMATTIEVSRDVDLDGHRLPRGKYSLWFVVDQGEEWTVLIDTDWNRFHTARPDARGGVVRFPARALSGPATEVLTFTFPDVTNSGTVLQFQWDDRLIRVPITVRPSMSPPERELWPR